jgi:hypothetical protein
MYGGSLVKSVMGMACPSFLGGNQVRIIKLAIMIRRNVFNPSLMRIPLWNPRELWNNLLSIIGWSTAPVSGHGYNRRGLLARHRQI